MCFKSSTPIRENVEISLQKVNFHGPDYLRGFGKSHNCLLAGVTILDGHRGIFISADHDPSYFKELGDIPRELALDSVLPEVTTCYDMPLADGDRVVMGLPMDTFVSFGQTLLVILYAYGAYVDLKKSDINLVIRPSHSAGLTVGCPTIPADGYLTIGSEEYSPSSAILNVKKNICPLGNVLFITLLPWSLMGSDALACDVIFCTRQQQKMKYMVLIVPHLSSQVGSSAVRSLLVQMNPYTAEMEMDCLIQVHDFAVLPQSLDYDLSIKYPAVIGDVEHSAAATSAALATHYFHQREQLTGRYVMLQILIPPARTRMKLNISLPCNEAFRVELPEKSILDNQIEHHLKQAADTAHCLNYLIPLSYKAKDNNNTRLIHISRPFYHNILDYIIRYKARAGKFTTFKFNQALNNFLFIAKISLYGKCVLHCKQVNVQIVYKTLVSHNIVSLEWNLILNSRGIPITLSDIPESGFLLYIMPLNDKCIEEVCSANIDIQFNAKEDHILHIWNGGASNQTPFADYHLLWTHRQYTWNAAEEICQQLDGMHLASISSEKEYLLVSRMLLGSAYYDMDIEDSRMSVLTPCLLGSPLCVIHVGLKLKVRQKN